ncbi:MAG: DUF937 domain-containing protein [Tsuneonella sp.]
MNMTQVLQQSGVIGSMASELGVDESTARKGAGALLPAIVAGMGRSHIGAGGGGGGLAGALGGLLGGGLGGGLLDSVLGKGATPTQPGNEILGEIFGNKDVSRGVAQEAAETSGVSPDLLKKMLPILAMAVVGYMAKNHGSQAGQGGQSSGGGGLLGGILGQVMGGLQGR